MSDKPELYATHPEDGKRHRWEIIAHRPAKRGEFYVDFNCNGFGVFKWVISLDSNTRNLILRDLGPAEGFDASTLIELGKWAEENSTLKARVRELESELLDRIEELEKTETKLDRSELDRQQAEAKVAELQLFTDKLKDDLDGQRRSQSAWHQEWLASEAKVKELEAALTFENKRAIMAESTVEELRRAEVHYVNRIVELENENSNWDIARKARRLLGQLDPKHPEKDLAWWRGKANQAEEKYRFCKSRLEASTDEPVRAFLSGFGTPPKDGENLAETICRAFDKVRRESRDRIHELEDLLRKMTAALEAAMAGSPPPVGVVRLYLKDGYDTGLFEVGSEFGSVNPGEYFLTFRDGPRACQAKHHLGGVARVLRRLDAPEEKQPEKPAPPNLAQPSDHIEVKVTDNDIAESEKHRLALVEKYRRENGPRPTGCDKCGLFDGFRCRCQQDLGCQGRDWVPDWCAIYPK